MMKSNAKAIPASGGNGKSGTPHNKTRLMTPKQIAERWITSTSSVNRIAKQAGFKRVRLGRGKNGTLRYLREEVENYEVDRTK